MLPFLFQVKVTQELERRLGPNAYFYDMNYVSQLAQPSLDTLLQGVYSRAKLDVVVLSTDYQNKDWCGVEFRAIREIIFRRSSSREKTLGSCSLGRMTVPSKACSERMAMLMLEHSTRQRLPTLSAIRLELLRRTSIASA
jgi:hypothetical protein